MRVVTYEKVACVCVGLGWCLVSLLEEQLPLQSLTVAAVAARVVLRWLQAQSSKKLANQQGQSAPAEGHGARPVRALLDEWLVELASRARVDRGPAVLAVVLQTRDVGAEEGSELAAAPATLALVADLIVQHVWLHLDLRQRRRHARPRGSSSLTLFSMSPCCSCTKRALMAAM